jgi:copper chaperone CopZ
MKIRILIIATIFFSFAFAKAQQSNNRDKYEIQVDGLGCPFCAYGLEKKFKEFKGIKDIAINIETGDFSFTYPAEKPLSMQQVIDQVNEAGYTPKDAVITRADGTVVNNSTEKMDFANAQETSLYVYGTCGMCKARIEGILNAMPSIETAEWDVDTKQLNVRYNPDGTSQRKIEQTLANAGHDTRNVKAKDGVYNKLPACCHYERDAK